MQANPKEGVPGDIAPRAFDFENIEFNNDTKYNENDKENSIKNKEMSCNENRLVVIPSIKVVRKK